MEQYSQYLMWMKSKNNLLLNPSCSHSWEEQAFAEDARGPLGGFIWPPRSYSCSFCRREFRSAQALGGHMNVHRRERAKLKQNVNGATVSTTTTAPQNDSNQSHFFPSTLSPSRVCSVLGQESLDSNSDTKSCVYDEVLVLANGNGDVETNLGLGFNLDSCLNTASGCKRRKTVVKPLVMGSMEGLDLELRLAS